jgi:hypothetical protein
MSSATISAPEILGDPEPDDPADQVQRQRLSERESHRAF